VLAVAFVRARSAFAVGSRRTVLSAFTVVEQGNAHRTGAGIEPGAEPSLAPAVCGARGGRRCRSSVTSAVGCSE